MIKECVISHSISILAIMNKIILYISIISITAAFVVFMVVRQTNNVEKSKIWRTESAVNLDATSQPRPRITYTVPLTECVCLNVQHEISSDSHDMLLAAIYTNSTVSRRGELASEKNQMMDELLNLPQMPSDYGVTMIGLFRDRSQDVLTRDFAVQHIGLYAQALLRQGTYDSGSKDAAACRAALFDAAKETKTIVAAAAFRALADMAEFDSNVDARRLDVALASCICDTSVALAVRVMAAQLCGERGVGSACSALKMASANPDTPEVLRRAAEWALASLDTKNPPR